MINKKSILTMALALCLIIPAMFMITACGCGNDKHTHTYSTEWSTNETHHWHTATCEHTDQKDKYGEHTVTTWTVKTEAGLHVNKVEQGTCSVCEKVVERTIENTATHTYSTTWSKNQTQHWKESTCEGHTPALKSEVADHSFGAWETKTPASSHQNKIEKRTCSECGYEETRTIENTAFHDDYELEYKSDKTGHWFECSCGEKVEFEEHTYGDWSEKTPAGENQDRQLSRKCSECEYEDVITFDNTKTNGTYCMVVTDIFTVSGNKTIQVKILRGTINLGDNLSIDGINGTFTIEQIKASTGTSLLNSASCGQEVYLVLEEESGNLNDISNLKRGYLMYEPNSVKSYKTFTAQIHLLTKDDVNNVGRNTPIANNTSFNTIIFNEEKDIKGTITFSNENGMIRSGETQIVTITLTSEVTLWEGMDFIIKEGSRKIVEGIILTVVNE